MKFIIKGPLKDNIYNLMRRIGYLFLDKDKTTGELSFVNPIRMVGKRCYPRFHIYLKIENDDLIFNLHLDQKRPIYKGAKSHSGEYEGEIVEKEAERIQQTLQK